jgi:hypothetical protein
MLDLVPHREELSLLEAAQVWEENDMLGVFGCVSVSQNWVAWNHGWTKLLERFQYVVRVAPNAGSETRNVLVVQCTHILGHV